jgi:hypothetical protein
MNFAQRQGRIRKFFIKTAKCKGVEDNFVLRQDLLDSAFVTNADHLITKHVNAKVRSLAIGVVDRITLTYASYKHCLEIG